MRLSDFAFMPYSDTRDDYLDHIASEAIQEDWGQDRRYLRNYVSDNFEIAHMQGKVKEAPDGHRWGRVVVVGGATITVGLAASLGNVDIRSSARTGPGYHDEAWEHGSEYPGVIVKWSTRRNLEECLRAIAEGTLRAEQQLDMVPARRKPVLDDVAGRSERGIR